MMKSHFKKQVFRNLFFVFFAIAMAGTTALYGQTIHYVKPTASGTGDGSSWANASADLKAMINASAGGDEVWVAAGTYKPTTDNNPYTSFSMAQGVAIYGGFAGIETQRSERDWATNETILSGDIGVQGVKSDNTYHVVI